jgi:NADPH-dependent curcumin reductase CurA
MTGNRQVWLKSRPNGIPQAENFDIRDSHVPSIAEGEFLVRNQYLSSDPAARGWIADASTYWPRIEIGDTMRAFAVGEVIESRNPRYAVGEKLMVCSVGRNTRPRPTSMSISRSHPVTCRSRCTSAFSG